MQRNIHSVVVNDQMALLLRFSRALCVAPVHIAKYSNKYRITLSRKYASYSVALGIVDSLVHISWYLLVIWLNYGIITIVYSTLAKAMKGVHIFVNICLIAVVTFKGLKRMDRFITYLNKIKEINQSIDNVYTNIRFKRRTMIFFGILILFQAMFIAKKTYELIKLRPVNKESLTIIIFSLLHNFSSIVTFTIGMQYIFIICLVNATFKVFNDRFRSLAVEGSTEVYSLIVARTRIELFYDTYVSLCNLVVDINRQDSSVFMLLFLNQVLSVFIAIHSIISCMPEMLLTVTHCWLVLFSLLHETVKLIILIEPCHRIGEETKEVQSVVSEVLSARRDLSSELDCFLLSFRLYKPAICPFAIFNFTRGLVLGVLGAATTFLTMILQFHVKDRF